MAAVARPKIQDTKPGELVAWARAGKIRIPAFQRSYRWERNDVTQLFDSIMRGYPIGNLLVWERPAEAGLVAIGQLEIDAAGRDDAYWIVDGQQRITSLVGALTAGPDTVDPRFQIYCDLSSGDFVSLSRHHRPAPHWMPVSLALDTAQANAWIRDRPELSDSQIRMADQMVAAIRDYSIPMYVVIGDDERALRDIFDRMNTYGKALKSSEVFNALHSISAGRQPNDLRALAERVNTFGFGEFPEQVLLQSMLAIRDPKVDRDFRKEFDSDDERGEAMRITESALGEVVDYLRDFANIPHLRLLPYALYIPVLARFTALFGLPKGRPAELLRRWIWRGAVLGVAPQGNTVGVRQGARAVADDPVASADRLLRLLPPGNKADWQPDLEQVRLNTAQGKVNALGLYALRPRRLVGDEVSKPLGPHELFDSPEFLRPIFPGTSVTAGGLANLILHPKSFPVGFRKAVISGGVAPSDLASHAIDAEGLMLLIDGNELAFLRHRSAQLRRIIGQHVQDRALFGFRDGPDMAALFDDGNDDESA